MEILIRPRCSRCGKDIVVTDPATGEQLQTTDYGEWMCEGCFKHQRHARAEVEREGEAMRKYIFGTALSAGHGIGPPRRLDINQSGIAFNDGGLER